MQEGRKTLREAEAALSGSTSAVKNELLFSSFGRNYNNEPPICRKGTILVRRELPQAETCEQPSSSLERVAEGRVQVVSTAAATLVEKGAAVGERVSGVDGGGGAQKKRGSKRQKLSKSNFELQKVHEDLIGNKFWDARPWILTAAHGRERD